MAREVEFKIPFEIPKDTRTKYQFRCYVISLIPQLGVFGQNGEDVGLGFVWYTQTGRVNGGLNTLSRQLQRWLKTAGLLSRNAEVYFLVQRLKFCHDDEPSAVFTLREE